MTDQDPNEGLHAWARNRGIYLVYVASLLLPGRLPPTHEAGPDSDVPLDGWDAEDQSLIIAEGQRHHDRALGEIDALRGRAQFAFTTGIALSGFMASQLDSVGKWATWIEVIFSLS